MSTKAIHAFSPAFALSRSERTSPQLMLMAIVAADVLALSVVYWLAVVGRHTISPGYTFRFYLNCFPVIALFLGAFQLDGLYPGVLLHPAEEIRRVFSSITVVFLILTSLTFLWRTGEIYSRSVFLITWAASAPVILVARHLIRQVCCRYSWWGYSAVVLGSGPAAQRAIRALRRDSSGIRITGVLSERYPNAWPHDLPHIVGSFSDATRIASRREADFAILAVSGQSGPELRQTIQNHCQGFRRILLLPDLPGICSMGIVAREVGGEPGFELPQRLFYPAATVTKRLLDVVAGLMFMLLLSPLLLLIAVLIRLDSRGPVLFGHSRLGRRHDSFKALKFRTMVPDAAQVLADYLRAYPAQRLEWERDHKLKDDPRVTRIGKWLRRYSLDELPQLWNVIRGDMSLVGPRPIVSAEVPKYGSGYDLYSRVLPGLTGLWQVSGRNNTTYGERVAFDEYYVRNWSIWLDAYILARTVKVVATGDGAY